jgi:hypothetical protein
MADGNSSILNLLLMETNSHNNDWGTQLNNDFSTVDRAAGLKTTAVVTTGGTVVRSQDQLIEFIQRVTGVLSSNVSIEVPAALQRANLWINDTTGNFTMTIKVIGQTGVPLLRGDSKILRCNGIDVVDAGIPAYSQLAGLAEWMGNASGTNAYTVAPNQYVEALADGLRITCFIANANTGPVSINFNGTGFKPVVHSDNSALAVGAIAASSIKTFLYYQASDKWYMSQVSAGALNQGITPTVLVDAATIAWDMAVSRANVTVTLSTDRAMGTPTNQVVGQLGYMEFVQPAGGGCNVTFPAAFSKMGTPFIDQLASARTVFGYLVQAVNAIQMWPLYMSGRNSIGFYRDLTPAALPGGGTVLLPHLLGALPALVQVYLECTSGNNSYAVGDRILIGDLKDSDNHRGFNVGYNATNVFVRVGENEAFLLNTSGNSNIPIPSSGWRVGARVYE